MSLVVENGTGVPGAQSYLTVAELRAFATQRALTLPVDDSEVEPLLIKACDFLALKSYIGTIAVDGQGLDWPRLATGYYSVSDGVYTFKIPDRLKTAQAMLALEAQNGDLTWATRPGKYKKTKMSALYVEFAADTDRASGLRMDAVDSLLQPLLSADSFMPLMVLHA